MEDMVNDLYEDPQGEKSEEDYPVCPFLQKHAPRIHDFCRFDRYKGKPRATGKLSITGDGKMWAVSLTDSDFERSFTVVAYNLEEALVSLEQLVSTRQVHWRYWGKASSGAKKAGTGMRRSGRRSA